MTVQIATKTHRLTIVPFRYLTFNNSIAEAVFKEKKYTLICHACEFLSP